MPWKLKIEGVSIVHLHTRLQRMLQLAHMGRWE